MNEYIGKILPILIPLMGIALPLVSAFGKIMRGYVEPLYPYFPTVSNFPFMATNWWYVIIGGSILLFGLVINLIWPERFKKEKIQSE